MQLPRLHSAADQIAEHLRQGLHEGRWSGRLPGVVRLAAECNVSTAVVRAALHQLEDEGLLSDRGLGRSRSIVGSQVADTLRRRLRVGILRHDKSPTDDPQTSAILTEIVHALEGLGHAPFYMMKSQIELKHNVQRVTKQLSTTPADAWLIEAGSLEVLEWCSRQATPCIALYGRTGNLALARTGPELEPACRDAARQLLALGHRRIVTIARATRRLPTPGRSERAILEELSAHGIVTSNYNLPDWEETPKGYNRLLETLFHRTPPTAMIIDETPLFVATVAFLARNGIRVPDHVSLVSTDCDATLDWCYPGFAHIKWDSRFIVRRVVRWVDAVRRGKPDRKVINIPAVFVPGGSIGPVRKG